MSESLARSYFETVCEAFDNGAQQFVLTPQDGLKLREILGPPAPKTEEIEEPL